MPQHKKEPWYPVSMWQGGCKRQSGHFREEKISCTYWDSNSGLSSP